MNLPALGNFFELIPLLSSPLSCLGVKNISENLSFFPVICIQLHSHCKPSSQLQLDRGGLPHRARVSLRPPPLPSLLPGEEDEEPVGEGEGGRANHGGAIPAVPLLDQVTRLDKSSQEHKSALKKDSESGEKV